MGSKPLRISPVEAQALSILYDRFLDRGMTVADLAEESGLGRTSAFNSVKGQRATSVSEFVALCRALGLTPWRVLRQAEQAVHTTTADPAATYIATAEAKLQAVLQGDYAPAARHHEPDPLEGLGEENQDEEEN